MQYHVIQKSYYIKLAIKVIAIVFTGAVMASVFLYYLTWKMLSVTDLLLLERVSSQIFFQTFIAFLIFSVFIVLGVVVLTLFYSHKIAGPLYRLKLALRKITADGQLDFRVAFRKGDVIHPMAQSLNEMIEQYNERINFLESRLLALKQSSALLLEGKVDEKKELLLIKQYLKKMSEVYNNIHV
ncbi:MAG TPA: hypothetical protein VJL89_05345 [Thermodesulfovibrionia bacterium]|nr:hypothetical protein [Thermodesulfovibrionia bacterium]